MAVPELPTSISSTGLPPLTVSTEATSHLVTPLEFDVLCSKDKTHSTHAGNRLFRERIDAMKEVYRMTKNKQGKMEITKNIVKFLKQQHATRFLKRDANGTWTEISDQAARDKVSHALRFATRRENNNNYPSTIASNSSSNKRVASPELQLDGGDAALANSNKPRAARESCDGTGQTANTQISSTVGSQVGPAAAATVVPESVYYGRMVPVEHIEPSKWLLALRQGP